MTWIDVLKHGGTMRDYTTDSNQREMLEALELEDQYKRIRQQIEDAGLCKWGYRKEAGDA